MHQKRQGKSQMPTVYVPHGGGPWPWLTPNSDGYAALKLYFQNVSTSLPRKPKEILVVSAHWEASNATVMTSSQPPMLYDYNGFPEHTYRINWPAPGATELADDVVKLLEQAGIRADRDANRGFDHGTFVPLSLICPDADIPTTQLSLRASLDPLEHLAIGRALQSLRERGVLLIGSGMSFHNMSAFGAYMRYGQPSKESRSFNEWLTESVMRPAQRREQLLIDWEKAPSARIAHPREEHLIPLHVIAGAAGNDSATLPYQGRILGASVSAIQFG